MSHKDHNIRYTFKMAYATYFPWYILRIIYDAQQTLTFLHITSTSWFILHLHVDTHLKWYMCNNFTMMHVEYIPWYILRIHLDAGHICTSVYITHLPWYMLHIHRDTYYTLPWYMFHIQLDTCCIYTVMHVTLTLWFMLHIHQGRIQEFWLGGRWFFFQRHGVWSPP